jgi:hypothetical protein
MSTIVGPKVLQTASFKCWICHFQWLCCTSRAISQACWRGPSLFIHPTDSGCQLHSC